MRANAVIVALLIWACDADPTEPEGGGGAGGSEPSAAADAGAKAGASGGQPAPAGSSAAGTAGSATAGAGGSTHAGDGGAALLDGAAGAAGMGAAANSACLDGIAGYGEPGPFEFQSTRSGQVNFWVPAVPAGCKLPVVHFANGTGGTCSAYAAILERLASHGFLTACYESTRGDDGTQCLAALEKTFEEYAGRVAMKIGSSGQETGGGAAIACVHGIEQAFPGATAAGHAIAPAFGSGGMAENWVEQFGRIEAPIFMFNGSEDGLVPESWVRSGYAALHSEKYWYEATGAPHLPVPVSWAAESAVVFFRWKLLGDAAAGDYFAAMPDSDRWELQEQSPGP